MQWHECKKQNYLCIKDSLNILFPCENQGVTLREEKAKLERMVEAHDKLIMEFTDKYGYNRNNEDSDDEDEDDDDEGHATTLPAPTPPIAGPEVIIVKEEDPMEMVPE
jgi:Ran GTPase-activating protein (RanGAP) involved in mRNA processing and transport